MKKIKVNTYSAIELDSKFIKIAQAQFVLASPRITRLIFSQIDDMSKPESSRDVRQLLEREKIKIDNCILLIPRRCVTTRYLKLPTSLDQEIDKMIKLQVPKLIPYAAGEIAYSYRKISSDEEGYSYCMVVLAQQSLVRQYYSFLQYLGINPLMAVLSSQACVNLLKFSKPDVAGSGSFMLVDVDAFDADILVVNSGELVFTRTIQRQAADSSQAGSWPARLKDEINRSLQTVNKEIGQQNISRLVFSGSISGTGGMDKELEGQFSFPVEIIPPQNDMLRGCKTSVIPAPAESNVSFSSVQGAVLGRDGFSLDLLPEDIKSKIRFKKTKAERNKALSLSLLLVLFLFILFSKNIFDKARLVNALDQRIKILLPKASTREQINLHFQAIRSHFDRKVFVSQVLSEAYKAIPQSISLSSLSIQSDKFLILKGEADNMPDIFNLVSALERSPYFEDVRVRYATKRRMRDLIVTDFQIDCTLRQNK